MSTTTLQGEQVAYPLPAIRYCCEALWTCQTAPGSGTTWRRDFTAMLATSEDISVIPRSISTLLDIFVDRVPQWRGRRVPRWQGLDCRIYRVEMWLPTRETDAANPRRFSLLARIPVEDSPPRDTPPYILLGGQFLVEYKVKVILETNARMGRLIIPGG